MQQPRTKLLFRLIMAKTQPELLERILDGRPSRPHDSAALPGAALQYSYHGLCDAVGPDAHARFLAADSDE